MLLITLDTSYAGVGIVDITGRRGGSSLFLCILQLPYMYPGVTYPITFLKILVSANSLTTEIISLSFFFYSFIRGSTFLVIFLNLD